MLVTVAVCFFFFNDTATTEIYTLSLHDALPILPGRRGRVAWDEYHQGFGKERSILGVLVGWLAGTPGGWALLQLVAVGLAGLAVAAGRFGAARPGLGGGRRAPPRHPPALAAGPAGAGGGGTAVRLPRR